MKRRREKGKETEEGEGKERRKGEGEDVSWSRINFKPYCQK